MTSCMHLVRTHLVRTKPTTPQITNWHEQHAKAFASYNGVEYAIRQCIEGFARYADAHQDRYDAPLGDDGVLGGYGYDMLMAIRHLLDGETGRYDCGSLCTLTSELAKAAGIDLDKPWGDD